MTSRRRRARQMRAALCFLSSAFCGRSRPGFGVVQGSERGQEQGVLEAFVPAAVGVLAFDRGAGPAGDRGQPGVGGQMRCGGEGAGVSDLDQDAGCGPDADSWHGGQDRGKRVVIEEPLDVLGDLCSRGEQVGQRMAMPGRMVSAAAVPATTTVCSPSAVQIASVRRVWIRGAASSARCRCGPARLCAARSARRSGPAAPAPPGG